MKKLLGIIATATLLATATSCLDSDDKSYGEWRKQNDAYMEKMENLTEDGQKVYTKIVPGWATEDYVLIKWHNDRALTANNPYPLSNSTIDITYDMYDINGESLGSSFASTTYGDSIYRSRPNNNIVGMWAAMLEMHVGDSVTMIIPYQSAYGSEQRTPILPYSDLIYHVKLKAVKKFERP